MHMKQCDATPVGLCDFNLPLWWSESSFFLCFFWCTPESALFIDYFRLSVSFFFVNPKTTLVHSIMNLLCYYYYNQHMGNCGIIWRMAYVTLETNWKHNYHFNCQNDMTVKQPFISSWSTYFNFVRIETKKIIVDKF